jgi:hypothetical protein
MKHVPTQTQPPLRTPGQWRFPGGVLSLAVAFTAAITTGCGPTGQTTAAPPTSSTRSATSHPGPANDPTSPPSGSDPTRPRSGSEPAAPDSVGLNRFCHEISLNLSFLTTAATSPDDPSLDQGIAAMRHLAEIAPAEIKPDIGVIADFDQHLLDQLRAGQRPEVKETPELTAALSHEAKWTAAHCAR